MPRKPTPEPVWNVYIEDWNSKTINVFNVFKHWGFVEACKKEYKKYRKPEQEKELEKEIKGWAMYCFWSKCEYEVIITGWPEPREDSGFKPIKIDIYDQLMLNWDSFFKYFVEHKAFFLRRS